MNSAQIIISSFDAEGNVIDTDVLKSGIDMLRSEFSGEESSKTECVAYLTGEGLSLELATDIVYRYLDV